MTSNPRSRAYAGALALCLMGSTALASPTTVTYRYDALGQLVGSAQDGQPRSAYNYDPAGNRTSAASYAAPPPPAVAHRPRSDLTGDGRDDLVWRNSDGSLAVWSFSGDGAGTPLALASTPYSATLAPDWRSFGEIDVNGDSRTDLVWRNVNGSIVAWTFDANAQVQAVYVNTSLDNDWAIIGTADFSGTGKGGVVFRRTSTGDVVLWNSDGSTLQPQNWTANIDASWTLVGTGDFNGDGRADLLWRRNTGDYSVWLSTGSGFTLNGPGGLLDTTWSVAGVADFDGDGFDDILWRNANGDYAVWCSGSGGLDTHSWGGHLDPSWVVAQVADVTGDGRADVVWRRRDGSIAIGRSTGTAFQPALAGTVPPTWNLATQNGAAPIPPHATNELDAGDTLAPGGVLFSPSGAYGLYVTSAGALELHAVSGGQPGALIWSAGVSGASSVSMQGDGNLVAYAGQQPLWAANTAGHLDAHLDVLDDGSVRVYDRDTEIWHSPNAPPPPPPPPPSGDTLASGQQMALGNCLHSATSGDQLCLQTDGNIVLYGPTGAPTWSTPLAADAATLVMQGDGDLVEFDANHAELWESGTDGNAGAYLRVEAGKLRIYASNQPIWERPADGLTSGRVVTVGDHLTSDDGHHELDVQDGSNGSVRGNLYFWNTQTNAFIWQSGTSCPGIPRLRLNPEGALVLLYKDQNGTEQVCWAQNASTGRAAHFVVQSDGNLVLYANDNNDVLWTSATQG